MKAKTPPSTLALISLLIALCCNAPGQSPSVWDGGGNNDNWSNPGNWGGNAPIPDAGYDLQFGGTTRPTPFNDFPDLSSFNSLIFNAGAAFILSGSSITLNGDLANLSSSLQTISNNLVVTTARTVTTAAGGGDFLFGGTISGTGGGLIKMGTGTLTLAGNNSYSGVTTVNEGAMTITGSLTNGGAITVDSAAASPPAVLNIAEGAIVRKTAGNLVVGSQNGYNGALHVAGGALTTLTAWGYNNLSIGAFGYGSFTVTGGSVDTRGFMLGSGNGSTGIGVGMISGGTVTVDNSVVIPYFSGTGVLTVSTNGSLLRTSGSKNLNVNQKGNGIGELNLLGGTIDNGDGVLGFGTGTTPAGGGNGIVNVNAGSLRTARFNPTTHGNSRLNFGGGTVLPSGHQTAFLPDIMTSVYINGAFGSFAGGAVIDTAGWDIAVAASLLAPTGEGISSVAVTHGGSGYLGAPYVAITDGSGGVAATAIANMVDDGTGNGTLKVDSIKITNPGVNYTAGTTSCTLRGGGASGDEAVPGTVTTVANSAGGLVKLGAGTLTLTGENTYTGGTIVGGGTLMVDNTTGSGTGSGAVTVQTGAQLSGSGTISGTVTAQAGAFLSPGDGGGTLTLGGDLILSGGGTAIFEITDAVTADKLVVGGNLSPAGTTTVSVPTSAGLAEGDYTLMEVTGALGGGPSNFEITGGNPSKAYGIVYQSGTPNRVVLRVSSAPVVLTWVGGAGPTGNVWDVGGATNWLDGAAASAVFNDGEPVVFDNTGAANPLVNITEKVSPVVVQVDATVDYVFAGSGYIAGSGALSKTGTGALTISNANTFSGGITLGAGTLNLNHPSAPGSGTLTILGGILDNTSGGPLTITDNNAQVWGGDFTFNGTSDLNLGLGDVSCSENRVVAITAGNLTVGGVSGAGGLTKTGIGTLTLAGVSTYGGPTTVPEGALAITGSLINDGALTTVDGGILTLGGPVETGSGAWMVGPTTRGVLNITPGAAVLRSGNLNIGSGAGSSGAINIMGGTSRTSWHGASTTLRLVFSGMAR